MQDKKSLVTVVIGGLGVIVVVLVIILGVLLMNGKSDKKFWVDLDNLSTGQLTNLLGNHILLPGEKPSVIQIKDVDKLKADKPEFYDQAENGDYLLVYSSKVIIYSAKKDKIINISPIIETSESEKDKK